MKKIFFSLYLVFVATISFAQFFEEGKVTYSIETAALSPTISQFKLSQEFGGSAELYIKGAGFKTIYKRGYYEWDMQISGYDRVYIKERGSRIIQWRQAQKDNDDPILKTEINKNVGSVLGYDCDELIFTFKTGVEKYYYSSKLNVNPKLFLYDGFSDFANYFRASGAIPLPLMRYFEMPEFAIEIRATKIESMPVSNEIFVFPVGSRIAKDEQR